MDICRQRFPQRTDLGNGHWTHCFLYGDGDASDDKSGQQWKVLCLNVKTGAQIWEPQSNGALYNPQSGRCLDDPGATTRIKS